MHSLDGTMALGWSMDRRRALMVRVLPVASVPWRTRLGGLGKPDYQVPEHVGWFLVRRFWTYGYEARELLDL